MELRHIRYFLAVAEERNFTRAAARLGIGQPPLSQQIRDLERELGAPLFHRLPHGAALTESGRAFLVEAESVVAAAERAKLAAQRAARGEAGLLAIGLTGSAAFHPIVTRTIRNFRRRYPTVQIKLEELNTMGLLDQLRREELDAIFLRPGLQELDGLHLHRLPDESMVAAIPKAHPLATSRSIALAALAQEPLILFPPAIGLSLYHEVLSACREAGFEPITSQIAPQIASGLSLVAAELGIAIVPQSIAQIAMRGIAYRRITDFVPVARLALATRTGREPALLRNLIQTLNGAL
ncbi:LysR family transcriptional regulator [Acidisoma cellulosilytica]|uniref:LysR family transcriptional regulator n=1 Tax=Acidisoma cellulosilyticum TaxID=2802395 RepID=A0A963Z670_9PROT|nr:LysR family transcriptional regulator [Acidisoma cellulosilyticum]MCB8883299.1 LysR family transcriptional regulator [Acidisoma cellulosilyticum]